MTKSTKTPLTDERKAEILDIVRDFRDIAETGNEDLMRRMRKAEDFCTGDQWDPGLQAAMEEKGKICISIPLIRPQIKQMVGHVVQNPKDFTVKNIRGGLKVLADVQSALLKHLLIDQEARHQIVQWFDQGATTGASYLALLLDMDSDPLHGNLEIRRLNEFEVLPDPTCQVYDWNQRKVGARFVLWESWEDADYIDQKWPDALGAYRSSGRPDTSGVRAMGGFINWLVGSAVSGISRLFWRKPEAELIEFEKLRYPVTHCWWKQHKKVQFFYDHRGGNDLDAFILTDPKEIAAARKAVEEYGEETFELKEAVVPQMNHTICLGDIILEHVEDEMNLLPTGETLFPVVPFHAFFNNGFSAGVAEDMIGVQEFINWTRSQVVNIMKNQPNSGWLIGKDAGNKKRWLEDHAGEDGIVIDKSLFGGYVEKIEPAPMPQLEHLTQLGREEIREVSNIRTESPQHEAKQMSGRAILAKQQAALTGVSPVMANFDYSLAIFGKLAAAVIRANPVYSDSEIKEIIEEKALIDPKLLQECREAVATALGIVLPPPPQPPNMLAVMGLRPGQLAPIKDQFDRHMATYQRLIQQIDQHARPMAIQALIDALRDPRRGRYNCRVALSPESLTSRTRELMELMEVNEILLASKYQPLPEKVILEATDLPHKDEILAARGYG